MARELFDDRRLPLRPVDAGHVLGGQEVPLATCEVAEPLDHRIGGLDELQAALHFERSELVAGAFIADLRDRVLLREPCVFAVRGLAGGQVVAERRAEELPDLP